MRPSAKMLEREAFDPFTSPAVIEKQQYMETELARGLISLSPIAPGHCLIVPKRPVQRFEELASEEVVEMSYVIRHTHEAIQEKLGPCDYVLLQKNGLCVGQNTNHLIWHYVPRSQSNPSVLLFTLRFAHPFHSRLDDETMKAWVNELKSVVYEEHEPTGIVIESSQNCKSLKTCQLSGCTETGDEVAPVPEGSRAMGY
jgi:diadenosine tetraphosphate (Ap4A) HIT family hydrolase